MYPDKLDIIRLMGRQAAEEQWQTVVTAKFFLLFAKRRLHSVGKHTITPFSEIKEWAESYIGPITKDAFNTAMRLAFWCNKPELEKIKFPPLSLSEQDVKDWQNSKAAVEEIFVQEAAEPDPLRWMA